MKVKRLKRLLEGLDDTLDVTIEVLTSEDQIASVDLEDLKDEVLGEVILFGREKGMA